MFYIGQVLYLVPERQGKFGQRTSNILANDSKLNNIYVGASKSGVMMERHCYEYYRKIGWQDNTYIFLNDCWPVWKKQSVQDFISTTCNARIVFKPEGLTPWTSILDILLWYESDKEYEVIYHDFLSSLFENGYTINVKLTRNQKIDCTVTALRRTILKFRARIQAEITKIGAWTRK